MKKIVPFILLITFSLTSCDSLFYDIRVVNNTSNVLYIYESEDGEPYEKIGTVNAFDESTEKSFYTGTEYTLQVRTFDGTVISTRVFEEQNSSVDKDWIIN